MTSRGRRVWPVQDAKARFSELLDATVEEGPQILTKRGVEMAVMVPIREWIRLKEAAPRDIKALLLANAPRAELPIPPRRRLRRRRPSALE